MRIGMLADVYKPHISGITNYISLSKKYLEADGHEVYIFTFGDNDYQDDETNVIRSQGLPLLDTGYYLSINYGKQAKKLLRTMDLVHVHHPFVSGNMAIRFCQPRGIPIIFTNHTRYDLYAQAYLPGVPEVIGEVALQTFLPTFCKNCDLVIAPSAGMRDVLKHFGVGVPIDVVPNGVDLQPFNQPIEPISREELGFTESDFVLIYVGRLGPEKNLPFLLRAVAGAAQAYGNIRLLLVGGGPEKDNLTDRVKYMKMTEHVKFVGSVEYSQVPSYLMTADAFVTASITEVHPLSIIEAMAAGLPVLGIESPGISDTIKDWVTGFLVENDDLAGFTAKMIRMAVEKEERDQIGKRAKLESEQYAIERTTRLMLERYYSVVAKASFRKGRIRARMTRWLDGFR